MEVYQGLFRKIRQQRGDTILGDKFEVHFQVKTGKRITGDGR